MTKLEQLTAKVRKLVVAEPESAVSVDWQPIHWTLAGFKRAILLRYFFLNASK